MKIKWVGPKIRVYRISDSKFIEKFIFFQKKNNKNDVLRKMLGRV